ncbi:hypothetical protein ACWD1Y_00455 [Streptomyces sp. NPDC002814]|jgi:hypothetical protein|uniref:hypothetical protein n=1 Tax=Streptomyces sp. GESEQ-4 TaxID=2812655 RepID=UPI001B32BEE7|nr:hypothetical protein [Streptomyces sp. GESEQ-4]
MLSFHMVMELLEVYLGQRAQAQLGVVGVLLLFLVGVGIRARRSGLAVGAAVVFVVLMTQA